jgi:sortase (surface protein transpeptidase)
MGFGLTPEGRAAGLETWLTARPAEPADDAWGILPVSGIPDGGRPAREDKRSAWGDNQPAWGDKRPAWGDKRPAWENEQPGWENEREDEQPARRGGHRGRLRLVRSPLAWAVLLAGLAVVVGGAIGLTRLSGGRPGDVARPLAKASPAPHGLFAAPPLPRARGPVSRPVALVIPAIGVHTHLIKLGRTAQGTLQVPTTTSVAGWYKGSPRPGEIGSSIIAGHIDSLAGPGVFFRLRLLRPGDLIYVRRANGTLAVFRVYAERMYPKPKFPTQQVYGPEPDAELHLITCGGVFDSATGSYLSNVVVYAAEIRHPPARRHHHQARRRHGRARRNHRQAHLLVVAHHPRARHS